MNTDKSEFLNPDFELPTYNEETDELNYFGLIIENYSKSPLNPDSGIKTIYSDPD